MPGHACEECQAFFSSVCDGNDIFREREMLNLCSRHKARDAPDMTPENFWEMSFNDERVEREKWERDARREGNVGDDGRVLTAANLSADE